MLVLNYSCVWYARLGIINNCITLIVACVDNFVLKTNASITESAIAIVKICVNCSCSDHSSISICGNALIFGIEIIVVECESHGQSLDDE